MKKFDKVVQEASNVIITKKKMFYPRQIDLSEEFVEALRREFYRLDEGLDEPIRDKSAKFLKAIRFQIQDLG